MKIAGPAQCAFGGYVAIVVLAGGGGLSRVTPSRQSTALGRAVDASDGFTSPLGPSLG